MSPGPLRDGGALGSPFAAPLTECGLERHAQKCLGLHVCSELWGRHCHRDGPTLIVVRTNQGWSFLRLGNVLPLRSTMHRNGDSVLTMAKKRCCIQVHGSGFGLHFRAHALTHGVQIGLEMNMSRETQHGIARVQQHRNLADGDGVRRKANISQAVEDLAIKQVLLRIDHFHLATQTSIPQHTQSGTFLPDRVPVRDCMLCPNMHSCKMHYHMRGMLGKGSDDLG